MSELKVNKISPETGTAITFGDSGDTFSIPSGATFANNGTATGFGGDAKYARQMKYVQQSTAIGFTSTSLSDTGLSLTFDSNLDSTSSLVKITFNTVYGMNNNPGGIRGEYRYDGSNKITNVIGNPDNHFIGQYGASSGYWNIVFSVCFATVSSTTPIAYRPFVRRGNSNGSQGYLGRTYDSADSYPIFFMIEEYSA